MCKHYGPGILKKKRQINSTGDDTELNSGRGHSWQRRRGTPDLTSLFIPANQDLFPDPQPQGPSNNSPCPLVGYCSNALQLLTHLILTSSLGARKVSQFYTWQDWHTSHTANGEAGVSAHVFQAIVLGQAAWSAPAHSNLSLWACTALLCCLVNSQGPQSTFAFPSLGSEMSSYTQVGFEGSWTDYTGQKLVFIKYRLCAKARASQEMALLVHKQLWP